MQIVLYCTVQFLCQLLSVPKKPLYVLVYILPDLVSWASGIGSKDYRAITCTCEWIFILPRSVIISPGFMCRKSH